MRSHMCIQMSFLHSHILIDDKVLQVSFTTFRWKETKEIEIWDCDSTTLQMQYAVLSVSRAHTCDTRRCNAHMWMIGIRGHTHTSTTWADAHVWHDSHRHTHIRITGDTDTSSTTWADTHVWHDSHPWIIRITGDTDTSSTTCTTTTLDTPQSGCATEVSKHCSKREKGKRPGGEKVRISCVHWDMYICGFHA